jgi:DNA-binding transcriptional MerR regulator
MEMRVEQLSVRAGLSVDTIRYYQSKGLLDPPRRAGRVAWYDDSHGERLVRIRTLQQRGFTLATIARLLSGDLDAADEALLGELSGVRSPVDDAAAGGPGQSTGPGGDALMTIDELAAATGVPPALLRSVEAEGLLIPRRVAGQERYTAEDVAAAKAGLCLLEWGIPLSALLALARRHHQATEAVAREAVTLFSTHVRRPLRRHAHADEDGPGDPDGGDVDRLVRAYAELLPAVNTLVSIHFTRTLVNAALDHVERTGSDAERAAIGNQIGVPGGHRSAVDGRAAPVPLS